MILAKLLKAGSILAFMLFLAAIFAVCQTWLFIPAGLCLFGAMMVGWIKP